MTQKTVDFSAGQITDGTAGGGTGDNVLSAGGLTFTITANGAWTADFSNNRFNFAEDPTHGGETFNVTVTYPGAVFDMADYTIFLTMNPVTVSGWNATMFVHSRNGTSGWDNGSGTGPFTYSSVWGTGAAITHAASHAIFDQNIIGQSFSGTTTFYLDDIVVDYTLTNSAPAVANNTGLTLNEGAAGTITATQLDFNDAEQGDSAITYTVTSAATNGTLFRNGVALAVNSTFTQADIGNSLITYTHNGGETTSASFGFSVSDGTASVTGQTFAFTVTPQNDSPLLSGLGDTVSTNEQTAVLLDTNATVSDAELNILNGGNGNYAGASLAIARSGGQNAQDSFGFNTTGALFTVSGSNLQSGGLTFATFTNTGGTLTVTYTSSGTTATSALANDVMQHVRYTNTSNTPPSNVSLTYTFNDGGAGGGQGGGGAGTATGTTTVNITAVNDAPTVINGTTVTLSAIAEDATSPTGATVSSLFGSHFADVDGNGFAGIMIGINNSNSGQGVWQVFTGGAWSNLPALDPNNTYLVSAADSLRFLPGSNYNGTPGTLVSLLIDDSAGAVVTGTRLDSSVTGSGGSTVYSNSTINLGTSVTAVNDAPSTPVDTDGVLNTVNEGAAAGTQVRITANAIDPENSAVTYSITAGNTGGAFAIDASTGVVTVADASAINYETLSSYTLTIEAADAQGATSSANFNVGVNNVAPSVPVDADGASDTVLEGAATGSTVGITASASDTNGGTITYSLADDAGGRFAIDSSTGIVTVANSALLNFENANQYTIVVRASDSGALFSQQSFVVDVTNAAPSAPVDADGATDAVLEEAANGTVVGITASATDPNGGTVTYSLSDNAGGRFTIDASTGIVTVANGSLLTASSYTISVQAQDSSSANSTASNFNISVTPVNDAPAGADKTIGLDEDDYHEFTAADFGFTDSDGNAFAGVTVGALPGAGVLYLDDVNGDPVAVLAGDFISAADITAGNFYFLPDTNENGTAYASFTFQVGDDGGTANGGVDTDPTPNTITFDVAAVNDAPRIFLQPALDVVVALPLEGGTGYIDIVSGDGDGHFLTDSPELAGDGPGAVAVSDFDGDGILDIAVANAFDDTVTILLGDGCGCFEEGPTSPVTVGDAPIALAVADMNGDAKDDLLVVNADDGTVDILTGDGLGGFTRGAPVAVSGTALAIAAADFNGDGDTDFVTVNDTGSITIALNDGAGGISTTLDFAFGGGTGEGTSVAVGDLDGDLDADIVLTDAVGGVITVFTGNGTGGFFAPVNFTVGAGPSDIALGDLNGDGKVDAAVANQTDGTISVLLGDGLGGFGAQTVYAVGDDPSTLALADMDEDGNLDIVVGHQGTEDLELLLGAGDGTFESTDVSPALGFITDIAIGNIDPDNEDLYPLFKEFYEGVPLALAPRLVLSDAEGDMIQGATVFLDDSGGPGGLPGDVLTATVTRAGITATWDAATFTLSFTGAASAADYQAVLRGVTFSSGSDPDDGGALPLRIAGITVDDGGVDGEGLSAPILIAITSVADDAVTTPETTVITGHVFAANPDTADSGLLTVAAVNGVSASVGSQITLASGALLTLNADGTFSYDPNHAFDALPDFATSGASNTTAVDSFTYTIEGGSIATVTVTLRGVDSFDFLAGTAANNILRGGIGDDTIDGSTGNDQMFGGAGNDTYYVDAMGDRISEGFGAGDDTVYATATHTLDDNVETLRQQGSANLAGNGNALRNYLYGNTGDNLLQGFGGNDIIQSGNGNDRLNGGTGVDQMRGGLGDDTYYVDDADDKTIETVGQGADTVYSSVAWRLSADTENLILQGAAALGNGNDLANTITGTDVVSLLQGFGGNDIVRGGSAADRLDGGIGADQMKGGNGNDIYYVDDAGDRVTELTGQGTDTVYSSVTFTLPTEVEYLFLSGTANISGNGNGDANAIVGNDGHNTLRGNGGNDILNGGIGNDTIDGGTGIDQMRGGTGDDIYFADESEDKAYEDSSAGTDTVYSSADYALGVNLEVLRLQGTADLLGNGNALRNLIYGNDGNNILQGFDGNDLLDGGLGNDRLHGGAGQDELIGGAGADTLEGGADNDQLTGGANADLFRFAPANSGTDTIFGFSTAEDRFDLQGGRFTSATVSGANTVLHHTGGTIVMSGVTGLSLSQWNVLAGITGSGGVTPSFAAPSNDSHTQDEVPDYLAGLATQHPIASAFATEYDTPPAAGPTPAETWLATYGAQQHDFMAA